MQSPADAAKISGSSGHAWPALRLGLAAEITALSNQIARTQWLKPAEIEDLQMRQFRALLGFAAQHSPFFAQRFAVTGTDIRDFRKPRDLGVLPLLSRRDLQSAGEAFFCTKLPEDQGRVGHTATSGSTGEPVQIRRTGIAQLFMHANSLRNHQWHQVPYHGRYSAIRANIGKLRETPDRGLPFALLFKTGPAQAMPITMPIEQQLKALSRFQPHTLSIYPTNLAALVEHWTRNGFDLANLTHIMSIGETLKEDLRMRVAAMQPNLRVIDAYSSQECGAIALQCPYGDGLHIMSEAAIVEVLNDADAPCSAGETGRVVVTDLQNLASPVIRYEIGDYAQVGEPCGCGRGLPKLQRILGRQRNLVVKPNGERHWPLVGFHDFDSIAPIRRYQLIQESLEHISVRFVTDHPLTPEQKKAFEKLIQNALGYAFTLDIIDQRADFPRPPNGKFEEFICKVA